MLNAIYKNIKCVVFDLDGTIYLGDKQLNDGANEFIKYAREKYGKVFFATNNSALTRNQVFDRLLKLGIDLKNEEVINSSYLIVKYLINNHIRDVWCLGTQNLCEELVQHGINPKSESPQYIVVGYNYNFSLSHIEEALSHYNEGCKIIVANKERAYPRDGGVLTPGAGAIVAAFLYTVNRKEDIIIGKPSTMMLETIAQQENLLPANILMIGDTYESDIKMAEDFGAVGLLITNGKKSNCNCPQIQGFRELLKEM